MLMFFHYINVTIFVDWYVQNITYGYIYRVDLQVYKYYLKTDNKISVTRN